MHPLGHPILKYGSLQIHKRTPYPNELEKMEMQKLGVVHKWKVENVI